MDWSPNDGLVSRANAADDLAAIRVRLESIRATPRREISRRGAVPALIRGGGLLRVKPAAARVPPEHPVTMTPPSSQTKPQKRSDTDCTPKAEPDELSPPIDGPDEGHQQLRQQFERHVQLAATKRAEAVDMAATARAALEAALAAKANLADQLRVEREAVTAAQVPMPR
jgi:hypothetical protein